VKVGEKDVADRQTMAIRLIQVFLHIALWIDDRGLTRLLVADQVRRVGKAVQIKLFKDH